MEDHGNLEGQLMVKAHPVRPTLEFLEIEMPNAVAEYSLWIPWNEYISLC